jgi:aspartate/methionine/tyrosine aminotransferase
MPLVNGNPIPQIARMTLKVSRRGLAPPFIATDVLRAANTREATGSCRKMLAEIAVATTPGRDFDPIHGNDGRRLSFAGSIDDIKEAADRLTTWPRS